MSTQVMAEPPLRGAGGAYSVFQQAMLRYRRYWKSTVVVSLLTPLFYLLALGVGLGTLVDSRGGVQTLGVSYLAFVAPAMIAVTGMQIGASEATFPILGGFQWDKVFFAMHATPLTPVQLVRGLIAFVAARVATACIVFYLIVAAFGAALTWQSIAVIPLATYGALAICVPIMVLSTVIEKDGAFNFVFRFLIVPMMLFSGTFYPIEELPQWGQVVAWITPLWHTNELVRWAALGPLPGTSVGELSAGMVGVHLGYLTALLIAGYLLLRRGFARRLIT